MSMPNEIDNPVARTKCLVDVLAGVQHLRKRGWEQPDTAQLIRLAQEVDFGDSPRPELVRLAARAIYALEILGNRT